MKLRQIKLTGFIGIQKGMGIEEIDIPLEDLAGLVALSGDNGMGKTTLLENLQPFRTLPSRRSTLKKHCYLKNSRKELTFGFNGDEYRTLVKMDPTTTVSDEGFIWKNGHSEVNGKVSEFDRYLVELMGSQNLFFNSIFCAQNSSKLSDLRPAELKALFAEFLRLDRYVAWEKTASALVKIYTNAIDARVYERDKVQTQIYLLGNPRGDLRVALKESEKSAKVLNDIKGRIAVDEFELSRLKKKSVESKVNSETLAGLEREAERLKSDHKKALDSNDSAVTDAMVKITALEDELASAEKTLDEKKDIKEAVVMVQAADEVLAGIDKKIENHEARNKLLDRLYSEAQEERIIKRREGELYRQDPSVIDEQDAISKKVGEVDDLEEKINKVNDQPAVLLAAAEIESMEKSSSVLDDIAPSCPCPPEVCGLITQAIEDRDNLPAKVQELEKLKADMCRVWMATIVRLREEVVAADEAVKKKVELQSRAVAGIEADIELLDQRCQELEDDLSGIETDLALAKTERKAWIDKRDKVKPLADKAATILVAESRINSINKQIDELNSGCDKMKKQHAIAIDELNRAIIVNKREITAIKDLIEPDIDTRIADLEEEISRHEKNKDEAWAQVQKMEEIIKACEREIAEIETHEVTIAFMDSNINDFSIERSQWSYLQDACSKDRLRALEIEGVAPIITGYANDMLTGTFGPKNSVRFETQDEDGKEILDIVVIDDAGSETLLSNLSGGESVWILKALRLAQTLISQQKSGRHFQTALMDEEDGALSNENAIRFIGLYGTLMKLAEMSTCFYISHRPDAINMADYQIKFRKGGVSII